MRVRYYTILIPALAFLAGCGGSNGGSAPTPPPVQSNSAPSASATVNIASVSENGSVVLDASGSTDPDGDTLSYSWSQISGPTAQIVASDQIDTVVNFDEVMRDEEAVFSLRVSDGILEATDTVAVKVENVRDTPDENGKLTILLTGRPVAVTQNLAEPEAPEFIYVVENADGTTEAKRYSVQLDDQGQIVEGRLSPVDAGFDGYGSDLRFTNGFVNSYTSDRTFFAVQSDRTLLMRDPVDKPPQTFDVVTEMVGENACSINFRVFGFPFESFIHTGNALIGHENGGASVYSWDTDNPWQISRNPFGENKSYCSIQVGIGGGKGIKTYNFLAIDVKGRTIDLYEMVASTQVNVNPGFQYTPNIHFVESYPFSAMGLDDDLSFVASDLETGMMLFSDGETSGRHQLIYIYIAALAPVNEGDIVIPYVIGHGLPEQVIKSRVISFESTAPLSIETAYNIPQGTGVFYLTEEDASSVLKLSVTGPSEVKTERVGGAGVESVSLTSVPGYAVMTYPDDNKIEVLPADD